MGRSALGVAVQTPKFAQRARSASPTEGRRPPESGLPSALRAWLACPTDGAIAQNDSVVRQAVEDLFFVSLPRENVRDLQISMLTGNTLSWLAFNEVLQAEDRRMSRVKIAWHLTKDAESAAAIEVEGINCDEGHCSCGRYGRGGYVALSAAKANAYGWDGEEAERHLFAVLALPDLQLVQGERGTRPKRTAADLPGAPTELCFVNGARLHCIASVRYTWSPTGRRMKVTCLDRPSHYAHSASRAKLEPHHPEQGRGAWLADGLRAA